MVQVPTKRAATSAVTAGESNFLTESVFVYMVFVFLVQVASCGVEGSG